MGAPGNRYIRHTRPRMQAPTRTSPPLHQRGRLFAAAVALALLAFCGAWLALADSAQAAPLVGARASVACTPTSQIGTQPSLTPATTASSQGIGGNTGETPCSTSTASSTPSAQHTASATPCTTTSPGALPTATHAPQTKPTPNPTNTPIRFPTAFPTIAPPKGPAHTNGQILGLLRNQYNAGVTGCGQAATAAPAPFNSDNIIYLLMITTAVLLVVMFGAFLLTLARRPRIQPVGQR